MVGKVSCVLGGSCHKKKLIVNSNKKNMQSTLCSLIEIAKKSKITHKHAAIFIRHGRPVSLGQINHVRSYSSNVLTGTLHAEMALFHQLLHSRYRCNLPSKSYVLFRCQ